MTDASELLKKKQTEIDTLAKKEADAATRRAADLQKRIREKDDERFTLENRVTAMKKELTDLDAKYRATQRELNDNLATTKVAAKNASEELANAKAAAAKTTEELDAARTQIKDLTKKAEDLTKKAEDLTKKAEDSNTTIIDLQGDKAKLADKFNKLQLERESRFAGIAMTGKKAVFLIDMSGSMGKRDLTNLDSGKWPMVIETACKVMRSIPSLEQYQVIVFSSSANWLFGNGEWQNFNGEKSVEAVNAALMKVKPKDDTNMYAALEKAFRCAIPASTRFTFSPTAYQRAERASRRRSSVRTRH